MQVLRARLLSLLLTLVVGCGLAGAGVAHPAPARAELALSVALAGLQPGEICGHPPGVPGCPDENCTTCMGGAVADAVAFVLPQPKAVLSSWGVTLPRGRVPLQDWRWIGHESRGPPVL